MEFTSTKFVPSSSTSAPAPSRFHAPSRWRRGAVRAGGRRRPSQRRLGPRVLLAGRLDAWSAPGGGEVQMAATARALAAAGVAARMWRPWEDALPAADVLHLFGSDPQHLPVVAAARRAGVPVALSTIAWFDLASYWRQGAHVGQRLAAAGKFLMRQSLPWLPSWRRRLYDQADLLLPNSQAEAEQLIRYFGVPAEKIRVVPNGADPRFAQGDPAPFQRRFGCSDFVLYAGRIEPRKNQLGFLQAMRGTGVPIVVLGDVVPGHESYGQACQRAADTHVRFLPALNHNDPLLASAYAACRCLVLASWFETPGLVALEAGMSGVPLVLPATGCAAEYFGPMARYVQAGDHRAIRTATLAAWREPRNDELARLVVTHYAWQAAARVTYEAYVHLTNTSVDQVARPTIHGA